MVFLGRDVEHIGVFAGGEVAIVEVNRVDMFAIFDDLVVQVRGFGATGASYFPDEVSALHVLTGAHIVGRKVSVEGYIAITVVDADVVAIA